MMDDLEIQEPEYDTQIKEERSMNKIEMPLAPQTEAMKQESSVEGFILQAIKSNVPVETLERLLVMRDRIKAEQAKEAYSNALASFQGECPTIVKTKDVKNKEGRVMYSYAPIDSIVNQVKELLSKHGLSYTVQTRTDEKTVTSVCIVRHVLGHTEASDMTVPISAGTQLMSAGQSVAAALTFAKRYAFLNALGIMTGDEDSEVALQETQLKTASMEVFEEKIRAAKTLEELKATWLNLPALAKKNLETVKNEVKLTIEETK